MSTKFEMKDLYKILLGFLAFGIGWFADNQNTLIAFASMLIVWGITTAGARYPWLKGKAVLTSLVFAVSLILAFLIQPSAFPTFPNWTGDAGSFVPLLSAWIAAFFAVAGHAVAFAMGIYNILLADVLRKIPALFSR